ncbi:MAG: hypothetical protein HY080_12980 [Gammaproteobacteria bacterium]|nr:hypothetical protein [Gammaproteobacteria bacterium]
MSKKPHLFLFTTTPITKIPKESFDDFKHWVLVDGLKPSVALRKMMGKYQCPQVDVSVPIECVKFTYPNIDIALNGFMFRMIDSAYPNSDPTQFSDKDFDQGLAEVLAHPMNQPV